jgi:UDP-N-acetylmuramate dehydrogenase
LNKPLKLRRDVRLAPLTTLGVGGKAGLFLTARTEADVAAAVRLADGEGIELFVLGGGSNVLIADEGFGGLVLKMQIRGVSVIDAMDGIVRVRANAGEDWDSLVADCVRKDLAGIECLSGIPGLVGGTPIQNVGAYGQEVSETIESVRCYDRGEGRIVSLTNAECGFAYRTSIFNSTHRGRYIVLSVDFALRQGGGPKIAYKDLRESFGESRPNLDAVRQTVLGIRRSKSMVISESDPNSKSAGSFFKNPVVENGRFAELQAEFGDIPHFPFDGRIKVPAAWLIDKAGFEKGYVMGNAGISTKHNLALINRGRARAEEIVSLQEHIKDAVRDEFGIELTPEPVFVGFDK